MYSAQKSKPAGKQTASKSGTGATPSTSRGLGNKTAKEERADDALENVRRQAAQGLEELTDTVDSVSDQARQEKIADLLQRIETNKEKAKNVEKSLVVRFDNLIRTVKAALITGLMDLKANGFDTLEQLEKDQTEAVCALEKLRATRETEGAKRTFRKRCDAHKKDKIPGVTAAGELEKLTLNKMHIPRFLAGTSGILWDWKDLDNWMLTAQRFLEVIKAQLVPQEDWSNVDICKWTWQEGETKEPGQIRCQEMLQTYLKPFLRLDGVAEAVHRLSDVNIRHKNKWQSFLNLIDANSTRNKNFTDFYLGETVGKRSPLPWFYVGIMECLTVRKAMGLTHTQVSGDVAAGNNSFDHDLDIGITQQSIWRYFTTSISETLLDSAKLCKILPSVIENCEVADDEPISGNPETVVTPVVTPPQAAAPSIPVVTEKIITSRATTKTNVALQNAALDSSDDSDVEQPRSSLLTPEKDRTRRTAVRGAAASKKACPEKDTPRTATTLKPRANLKTITGKK